MMYQAHVRKSLLREIISNDLPLSSIGQKGLQEFMKVVCPSVQIPFHEMISADCVQLFLDEKLKLKSFIKTNSHRVCLTLDTWTPNQIVNYLCISAHFIDDNWDKHKKILSFTPLYRGDGEEIGKLVEKCLHDWEIDGVMAITIGNVRSGDVAISYLRERLTNVVLDGKFLHSRCLVGVITDLINVALDEYDDSITRVRAAVLYVRHSSARTNKFKQCAKESGIDFKIDFKHFLFLDCSNKLITTLEMLFTFEQYEKAFNLFGILDPGFKHQLEETCGVLDHDDWENARKVLGFLAVAWDLSKNMVGFNATSDTLILNISLIEFKFCDWAKGADTRTKTMVLKMREKYCNYWGNVEELNMLICVASILDPSIKGQNIKYYYEHIYNREDLFDDKDEDEDEDEDDDGYGYGYVDEDGVRDGDKKEDEGEDGDGDGERNEDENRDRDIDGDGDGDGDGDEDEDEDYEFDVSLWEKIMMLAIDTLSDLCYEYKDKIGTPQQSENFQERFKKRKLDDEDNVRDDTEMLRYLTEDFVGHEAFVNDNGEFDVLLWWKNNSERYPVLSKVAKDVLAIPVSVVGSESDFNAKCGRLIDDFRSSLPPSIVEALVCTEDWRDTSQQPKESGRSSA